MRRLGALSLLSNIRARAERERGGFVETYSKALYCHQYSYSRASWMFGTPNIHLLHGKLRPLLFAEIEFLMNKLVCTPVCFFL